jgi:RIO-like serine/threonine protein kinase
MLGLCFHFLNADTVDIAHKEAYLNGVLHCDISPGNILITDDHGSGGGLLIDWDVCKVKDDEKGQTIKHRSSWTVRVIPGVWISMM